MCASTFHWITSSCCCCCYVSACCCCCYDINIYIQYIYFRYFVIKHYEEVKYERRFPNDSLAVSYNALNFGESVQIRIEWTKMCVPYMIRAKTTHFPKYKRESIHLGIAKSNSYIFFLTSYSHVQFNWMAKKHVKLYTMSLFGRINIPNSKQLFFFGGTTMWIRGVKIATKGGKGWAANKLHATSVI